MTNQSFFAKIDDRGELDLERRIEESTNEILFLKEHIEQLKLRIKYLQQQIRTYGVKDYGKKD